MTMDRIAFISIAVASLALGGFLLLRGGDTTGPRARELVKDGARLVDVRSPAEFAAGHIAGAVNIPVQELPGRMGELEPKEQPVVLYCRSGARSGRAAKLLKGAGYTQVHDLGSISRW